MRILVIHSGNYAERFVGNLLNLPGFCRACGHECVQCRSVLPSFEENIVDVIELQRREDLPEFLDDPDELLPSEIPRADIGIVLEVHPDLLILLAELMIESGFKALIYPAESPEDVPRYHKMEIGRLCRESGIECSFPKPFCTLDPRGGILEEFSRRFMIGKPELELEIEEDRIVSARVLRSAPCGSTWFVARRLIGTRVEEFWDRAALAFHSYPCTGSMRLDPELGDTILHVGGLTLKRSIEEAIRRAMR